LTLLSKKKSMKYTTAEETVKLISSGQRVFIHSAAAAPRQLIEALTARNGELTGGRDDHMHTEGEAPYARPECAGAFRVNAFFVSG
jgi:acyl-CoA hydrolase